MASIRDIKKDINVAFSDIIETVYAWEAHSGQSDSEAGTVIIEKAIAAFDDLVSKIHQKPATNRKAHFRSIRAQLEEKAAELIEDLNTLPQ